MNDLVANLSDSIFWAEKASCHLVQKHRWPNLGEGLRSGFTFAIAFRFPDLEWDFRLKVSLLNKSSASKLLRSKINPW